ncbi:MAG: nuclear transport factor 2 family protein [Gammaproteobacteria bacterium]|nr:nuclear transport factor 2 family protein [Gammaproteobacteria bacterium]
MTAEELIAREQIRDVLYRYCRGVDRGDTELIASVYHSDAIDEHGAFHGTGVDFAAFITGVMDGVSIVGQHHLTNILIAIEGQEAAVESYFIAFHPYQPESEAAPVLAMVGGRYLDRFACREGGWKIAHRRVVLDWSRERLPGDDWLAQAQFPVGGRREADPSAGLF